MSSYLPYEVFAPDNSDVPFPQFGILLPALMLSLLPALLLLYLATVVNSKILFLGAIVLCIFILVASTIVIVISGILGVMAHRKYRKLARPNTHLQRRR